MTMNDLAMESGYLYTCPPWASVLKSITNNDVRHEKTDLKVFVVVIPKEGRARVRARVAAPILRLV